MEITRECKSYEEVLLPDEQVEWTGKPAAFPLLTEENRGFLLLRWICCGVVFVGLTALYIAAAIFTAAQFNIIVELVIIAACAFVSFIPIRDWIDLRKKVRYYVTNKRVILAVGKSIYALNRSGIKVERRSAEGGGIHVLFGSCVGISGRKCRRATVLPEIDEADLGKNGFVFYNVKEGKTELEALFSL